MKPKIFLQCLQEGFTLAKSSLDIFLISLPLSLFSFLSIFIHDSLFGTLNLIALLLSSSFNMSLPLFLQKKQLNGKSNYKGILLITLKSTKRIILPGLLIFFILAVILIALVIAIYSIIPLSQAQIQVVAKSSLIWWKIFFAVLSILLLIFEFTSFYFSLENKGLFESMRRSILTAFRNLPYLFYLTVINLVAFLLALLVPAESQIGQFAISIVSFFIRFILTSTTFIYYQKVIKKT